MAGLATRSLLKPVKEAAKPLKYIYDYAFLLIDSAPIFVRFVPS